MGGTVQAMKMWILKLLAILLALKITFANAHLMFRSSPQQPQYYAPP